MGRRGQKNRPVSCEAQRRGRKTSVPTKTDKTEKRSVCDPIRRSAAGTCTLPEPHALLSATTFNPPPETELTHSEAGLALEAAGGTRRSGLETPDLECFCWTRVDSAGSSDVYIHNVKSCRRRLYEFLCGCDLVQTSHPHKCKSAAAPQIPAFKYEAAYGHTVQTINLY